ncbi:MAG: serine hydrolase [Lacipirellulaceae bacterium]
MLRSLRCLFGVVAALVPALGSGQTDDLRASIVRHAQPYVDAEVVVGMSIGALRGDEECFVGLGSVGDGRGEPDADTLYEIGSVTKVFTGLLLADAVTAGVVKLDQPLAELLPPGVKAPLRGRPITLRDLSTHVSGLPRLPSNLDLSAVDPANPYMGYTGKDVAAFLNGHTLAREPGTKAEYSNLAVGLLGSVVARKQGLGYGEAVAKRIAGPLGMSDTTVALSDEQRARLATPHDAGGVATYDWDMGSMAGAGAIRSTARDMVRFARANMTLPKGKLGEAIELAWKVHQKPIVKEDFAMGLGWHVARDGTTRWHNGQTGGYHAMILVSRQLDAAVVVLANSATMEVDALAQSLVLVVSGRDVVPREFSKEVEVAPEVMRRYVGKYRLAPGIDFTVTEEDGKLIVGLTGQSALRVYPRSETVWEYREVEADLTFEIDDAGKATSVTLFQNGVRQRAKRLD